MVTSDKDDERHDISDCSDQDYDRKYVDHEDLLDDLFRVYRSVREIRSEVNCFQLEIGRVSG